MTGQGSDRGVSEVIGFVLIFALVVISWTIFQGVAVPEQNKNAEINHNDRVQGDILNLRDAILRTGTSGVSQSVTITLGADYPRRTIMVNFAVTGGVLETRDPASNRNNNITVSNVTAIDQETADYFDGTINFTTKSIIYQPVYTRYRDSPDTVVAGGGGAVFNEFNKVNLSLGDQVIISDRTITIVTIEGNLSKAKGGEGVSETLETKALSVASNRVTIKDDGTGLIRITLPTQIDDKTVWKNASLSDEIDPNGRIDRVTAGQNSISIFLKKGHYTVRIMRVGVGTGTTEPEAEYITDIENFGSTLGDNSTEKIAFEVRDKYNNPVDGFTVNATIDGGATDSQVLGTLSVVGEEDSTSATGDANSIDANTSNGQVEFEFDPADITTADSGAVTVNISIEIFTGANDREVVWANTTIIDD